MTDALDYQLTRRRLLRVGGCAGAAIVASGVGAGLVATQTDLIDRLRGVTDMPLLENDAAWTYADQVLTLDLALVPDLAAPASAVRVENDALPGPLLIVRSADDTYHVFLNECTHGQRKLDLSDGKLTCTSVSSSTFDLSGARKSGPAKDALTTYTATVEADRLVITLA